MEKMIIIGGGPAGLTAAIYAARADLKPLCIAGFTPGGQLMNTTDVENYPGFPQGIMGPELMQHFRRQAERFGTQFVDENATAVTFLKKPFTVQAGSQSWQAQTIVIATGANPKLLNIPGEKTLMGRGVSTCATCDGAFFRDEVICVAGGGD